MRNKVKRTLSFLLTFVMLCSLLPAMALAQEPEGRYEEVEGTGAITENAKVEVYTTKGGGHVERTGDNLVDTTFPQMTGYREYTATPNTDWVFDTWRYEQWVGRDENNRKDVGNDTEVGTRRYSFSNTGNDWYTKYETGNRTISVNRLSLHGDLLNPIVYKVYADFNPTIKATAGANGTISDAEKQVEVTYGEDQAFDIKANDGYVIDTIKVDGEDVEEGKNAESYTYTFENVTEPHTIDVTFDTDRTVEVTFTVNSEYGSFTDYGKGPVTFKGLPENSTEQYSVPKVTANSGYKSGKTVEVTFTVNPEYGSFTEYGEGPVTFKNIDAESTQQFEVPKVTAKKGYKFVGWKGQGADVIEWDANASTFGVPGLCYFTEGSNVGYASIEAVFEEVPVSGKTVEVTFTVNPEYGSFTEYGEGPVTFKNIDAESTQQFEVPKVTAKKGYKFVGWKGQGADVIEWDANASTFGVPGLCYFAEGSNVGYASIAAVFEKEGGGHTNDYYVTVIVDGKGKVKAEDYGTVGSNETEVIIIPDVENSVKFTMEPADGWKVDDVLVDGKSVGDVDSYVLKDDVMLEGPVLKVIFEKKSSGGGGGGSHDKDDDKDKTPAKTPDALNGEDHFDYIVGDADGRVHPERNITRAEVASIFFRLLKDDVRSENLTDQNTFTDVSADAWYNVAVSTMSDMDIVFGRTDYQFDPDAYITRAEFAAIAARFDSGSYSGDDLFTDIEGHWAADQINRAAEKGWITGYPDGTFGPNRYITRAEAVTMINRVLNRMPKDKDALHEDMKVFVDNADTNAWYYLAIQEATNSHEYKKDKDGVYETWTDVLPARDWAQYLKLN